uniref:Uncharacterized protein n=1 Tax=Timema poppense TaxID=170557 RepID=A0A7R9HEU2_TIMPO|nr:unnamed protein product [Timema poppensis]
MIPSRGCYKMANTSHKGKMSMFELGKLFRQRYQGFLSRLYSPKEMHMESSANDRCLMSAELVLAGLYPPIGSQVWNHDLNWQPIPVHSTPRLQDKLIVMKKPCPRYEQELKQAYLSPDIAQVNLDNAELLLLPHGEDGERHRLHLGGGISLQHTGD